MAEDGELDRVDELAFGRVERFRQEGGRGDLDEAIELRRRSAEESPRGSFELADRSAWLAEDLRRRYEAFGSVADLQDAIVAARTAVESSVGYAEEAEHQRLYGICLLDRYERLADPADLDSGLEWCARAANAADPGRRWRHLASLGIAHTLRYDATDRLDVLDDAVAVLRECVRTTPADEPHRHIGLGDLAHALCLRFDRRGDPADLDEAIQRADDTVAAAGDQNSTAHWQSVLGAALRMRYDKTGAPEDLTAAMMVLTSSVLDTPDDHPEKPRRSRELGLTYRDQFDVTGDSDLLTQAVEIQRAGVVATPVDHPERPMWQASLGNAYLHRFQHGGDHADLDEAIRLLEESTSDMSPEEPEFPLWSGVYADALQLRFAAKDIAADLDAAVAAVAGVVSALPDDHRAYPRWLASLADVLLTRHEYHGSAEDLARARELLTSAGEAPHLSGVEIAKLQVGLSDALHASYLNSADTRLLAEAIDRGDRALRQLPQDQTQFPLALNNQATCLLSRFEHSAHPEDAQAATALLEHALELLPDGHRWRAQLLVNLGSARLYRYQRPVGTHPDTIDHDLADGAIACFDEALRIPGIDRPVTDGAIELLARSVRLRHVRRPGPGTAERLIDMEQRLAAASERLATARGSNRRIAILREHAQVLRALGRAEPARALAKEALRGRTWDVLVQANTAAAAHRARRAVNEAEPLIKWCFEDNAVADALVAVESVRALVVHSVTVRATVTELLRARGLTELHDTWQHTIAEGRRETGAGQHRREAAVTVTTPDSVAIPDELRHRILRALLDNPKESDMDIQSRAVAELLDPPDPTELAVGCRMLGVDAVVYLVQGADGAPGWALFLHANGALHGLRLPRLVETARGALTRFVAAHDRRLNDPDDIALAGRWRTALDRLLAWAWTAAMSPVIGQLTQDVRDRPPRLVLIPTGQLSLVPWHAARRRNTRDGAISHRYAIEQAVISYAPSARVLQWFARTTLPPPNRRSLIVVDPTHDLPHARGEGESLLRAHYPNATRLGGSGEDRVAPATPQSVLDHLASTIDGDELALAHFACHGVAMADPGSSYLLLANDHQLTVDTMLAHGRRSSGAGPLVVLSVCASAVPAAQYDEALSLATGFAAIGAAAVVGSLWAISDGATALLMRDFHQFLNQDHLPPADAPRAAQLHFLERIRKHPGHNQTTPDDAWRWAAFVHYGNGHSPT